MPEAGRFATVAQWEAAKVHAHCLWFAFLGIAATLAVDLIVFGMIARWIDARLAAEGKILT